MANQYVNKVVYSGDTLIDLTSDTISSDKLLNGTTAHASNGAPIRGSMSNVGCQTATITQPIQTVNISKGYHDGTGSVTINETIAPSMIKPNTTILGVSGTYTNDATATATDLMSGKTAYVAGSKVTGSLQVSTLYTGTGEPHSALGNDGDIYIIIS